MSPLAESEILGYEIKTNEGKISETIKGRYKPICDHNCSPVTDNIFIKESNKKNKKSNFQRKITVLELSLILKDILDHLDDYKPSPEIQKLIDRI